MAKEIMTSKEILSYISTALKLELELRSMKETKSLWESQIGSLGIPAQLKKPSTVPLPIFGKSPAKEAIKFFFIALAGLMFNPVSLIMGASMSITGADDILHTAIVVIVIVSVLAGVIGYLGTKSENKQKRKENKTAHEIDIARYERELKADNARLRKENLQIGGYKRDLATLNKTISIHEQMLKKLYAVPVVHPNYQDPVAMASFYDYLSTGRCDTLTGHEGAYNLYENERRLDRIVDKLDVVISMLYDIKENQRTLYYSIQAANRKMDKIAELTAKNIQAVNDQNVYLGKVEENTKLIAQNTAATARHTKLMADLDYYTKRMNGEIPANVLPNRGFALGIE